jgi:hemerythrin superfamily protein
LADRRASKEEKRVDLYSLLKQDHQRVAELLQRLQATDTANSRERLRLFEMLKRELTAHKEAEEQTFYAALSTIPEISDRIEEALEEHADVDELVQELDGLEPDELDFIAQLDELREEIEHHVSEEENEIFPRAQELLMPEQAQRIARELQAIKQKLSA